MDPSETNTSETAGPDHAGVIAHPPVVYLAALLIGLGIDAIWPAPFLPPAVQYAIGGVLIAASLVLAATAFHLFGKAGTNIPTNRPTNALVTDGPYRFSRNPIYIGLTLLYVGIGIAVDSPWVLGLVIPVLQLINYGVIAREEKYLERKFGDAYRRYRQSVRRWL